MTADKIIKTTAFYALVLVIAVSMFPQLAVLAGLF